MFGWDFFLIIDSKGYIYYMFLSVVSSLVFITAISDCFFSLLLVFLFGFLVVILVLLFE